MDNLTIEALQHYEDHPSEFCEDLIGVKLDSWQKRAFDALIEKHFVAIRSGSGIGKSVLMSLATMFFLSTKFESKVPSTAPSQHQLFDILWAEHNKWINRSAYLQEMLSWHQTKVTVKGYEPRWFAVARTSRTKANGVVSEGLQGFHAENDLLFIVDEASGVPDEIFPAIEGALTGKGAYVILCSNPTRNTGYFWRVFNSPQMQGMYELIHVSCLDSPFVSERYIRMMEDTYGVNSPIYQVKVLGNFPQSDINMLFPLEDITAMQNNQETDVGINSSFPIKFGVDVGRTTNKSVLVISQGFRVLEEITLGLKGDTTDTLLIANWIIEHAYTYNPAEIFIDAVGIGAGVYDTVKAHFPGITYAVQGQARSTDQSRYANLRAEIYWNLRGNLRNIYHPKFDENLMSELVSIDYSLSNGKILISSKEDIARKNKGRSPDRVDAMTYSFMTTNMLSLIDRIPVVINFPSVNERMKRRQNKWDMDKKVSRFGNSRWMIQ